MSRVQSRREYESALCERVRTLRESANYTQFEMAEVLGVSQEQYRKYEVRSQMPAYYLVRFAIIMRVDLDYLLTGHNKSTPRKRTATDQPIARSPRGKANRA